MTVSCEDCATATNRCVVCDQPRCASHLALSVEEHVRVGPNGGDLLVLRCHFADAHVVDFPLDPGLSDEDRALWSSGWKAGTNTCLSCRDDAGARAMTVVVAKEPEERAAEVASPEHAQAVTRVRDEYGTDQAYRARHAKLLRTVGKPGVQFVVLTLLALTVAGAVVGGLLQSSADWVTTVDEQVRPDADPLLLAATDRTVAGYLVGAIGGLLVALVLLLGLSIRARRGRRRRLKELDDLTARIGCGTPGCTLCWVPPATASMRLAEPVPAYRTALLAMVGVAVVLGFAYLAVVRPAEAVSAFADSGVPSAIAADCTSRPPSAGDYELACAGPAVRRRKLSKVLYRHYRGGPEADLTTAFAADPAFKDCADKTVDGASGRLAVCAATGRRGASVWRVDEHTIGAAFGRNAERFARVQLGLPVD
jgi:hypothetical protein